MGNILEKSSMEFKLPDGKTFLLAKEDIKYIADQLYIELIMNKPSCVYVLKDAALSRAVELYKVFQNEKDRMTEKMQQECLKTIIKYLSDNNFELDTLQKLIDESKKNNP